MSSTTEISIISTTQTVVSKEGPTYRYGGCKPLRVEVRGVPQLVVELEERKRKLKTHDQPVLINIGT